MKRIVALLIFLAWAFPALAAPPCPSNVSPTASSCWAYDETTGTTAYDAIAINDGTFQGSYTLTGSGVQLSAAGNGFVSTATQLTQPLPMTMIISFAGTGGGLMEFGNPSQTSSSQQAYILYLSSYGTGVFGSYNFGLQNTIKSLQPGTQANGITGVAYNDGNPHTIVASIGPAGMKLYADGLKIASNAATTSGPPLSGFWTVGTANTTSWPLSPGNLSFNGTVYYSAVWQGTQLTDAQAIAATAGAPPPVNNIPLCTIYGNIATIAQNLGFSYSNQSIVFTTNPGPQLPNGLGAQIVAPGTTTVTTDAAGNLPTGFQLPQGAHVMMSIGSGTTPSRQIPLTVPLQTSVELAGLVLAEVDPPQVVSQIDLLGPLLLGYSVLNPAPGQIGPATIVSPNSVPTTCGSACTIAPSTGPVQSVLMTANVAINLCGQQDGQYFYVDTIENATGGWQPGFTACAPFTIIWNNGNGTLQPQMATTAPNAHQIWNFVVEGNTIVGSVVTGGSAASGTLDMNYYSIIHINQADFVQLSPPASLTLSPTCTGTCATTYTYDVTCAGDFGQSLPIQATTSNAASLSGSNFNTISWPPTLGCHGGYNVYGRVGGSVGLLATVSTTSYTDQGVASPGAAPPVSNTTGQACFIGSTSGSACISGQAAAGNPPTLRIPPTVAPFVGAPLTAVDTLGDLTWGGSSQTGTLTSARHLTGDPNGGSPSTTFNLTAQSVTMVAPSTGQVIQQNTLSVACLVVGVQSGSVANGRDQTTAFALNTFFHYYAIGGTGQTTACLASLSPPPTGPTMPTGYTTFAYLGTGLTDGSANLLPMYFRGSRDYYKSNQLVLSGGAATSSTVVAISTFVPSIANSYQLFFLARGSATGVGGFFVDLALVSGTLDETTAFYPIRLDSQVSTVITGYSGWVDMPYISGGFYYRWHDPNTLTLADLSVSFQVQSFNVPNGAT